MAQAEQYFAAEPQSKDVRRKLHVTLRGNEADVEVSNGVFSGNRVDLGTSVLLRQAPEPPEEGTFLDLGCGWGPIALTLGFESPKADIWALDVNERALELTRRNAELNGMGNIHAVTAEQVPAVLTFDLIWSNPPIRVGKEALHELLMTWLPRLNPAGAAYLVFAYVHPFPADVDPANLTSGRENGWKLLGATVGFGISWWLDRRYIHFDTRAVWWVQLLKVVLGLALLMGIRAGLKAPLLALLHSPGVAGAVRYGIMVLFAGALWPAAFRYMARWGRKA